MNFQNFEINHKEHKDLKKKLNKSKYNIIEQYKAMICPSCTHYKDINYQDCKICRCVDGVVRCQEYKRRKENEI